MTEEQRKERDLEFKNLRKSKNRIICDLVTNSDEFFIDRIDWLYDLYQSKWDRLILLKIWFDNKDIFPYQIKYIDDLVTKNIWKDAEYYWYHTYIRNKKFYVEIDIYSIE